MYAVITSHQPDMRNNMKRLQKVHVYVCAALDSRWYNFGLIVYKYKYKYHTIVDQHWNTLSLGSYLYPV